MKQFGYSDYAEFRSERGARVRKTENAEIKELQQHISTLIEQKDYFCIDLLRNLASTFAADTQDEARDRQERIAFAAAKMLIASDRSLQLASGVLHKCN